MTKICISGCCHGALDKIYNNIEKDTDFLIITGDFQALRNHQDLNTMSVPEKYRQMGDFHHYYNGDKIAPLLTILIGGNHECLSYFTELRYGGWLAPNIYYLGEFGSIWYKGLRITGISGVYNERSFRESLSDSTIDQFPLPYDSKSLKSVYHIRAKQYIKMLLIGHSHIAISHDWPRNVWDHGRKNPFKKKPWLEADRKISKLGNPLMENALNLNRPSYWFSLHLHMDLEARVTHSSENSSKNDSEISLDMDDCEDSKQEFIEPTMTMFLALGKAVPGQKFIKHLSIDSENSGPLSYDSRAAAINKVVEEFFLDHPTYFRGWLVDDMLNFEKMGPFLRRMEPKITDQINKINVELKIPQNFSKIAPSSKEEIPPLQYWNNPQTEEYCRKFNVPPLWFMNSRKRSFSTSQNST